jgi:integrase
VSPSAASALSWIQWKADIDRARAGLPGAARTRDDDAAFFRRSLRNAGTGEQRGGVLEHIERVADEIGMISVDHIGQAPSSAPEARAFYAEATGQVVPTLEHLDEWQSASNSTSKTKSRNRSDVTRFAVAFPKLSDIQRQAVRKWLASLAQEEQLQARTIKRILGSVRTYWRWLQSAGVVSETDEPFDKMEVARLSRGRAGAEVRQPFEPADAPRLVQGALDRGDGKLADLITLAMWSGARIAELCALRCTSVNGDSFKIEASKTDAGRRVVPIHPELRPTMARLVKDSKDGFVLSGLSADKYGARSDAIG